MADGDSVSCRKRRLVSQVQHVVCVNQMTVNAVVTIRRLALDQQIEKHSETEKKRLVDDPVGESLIS